VYDDATNHWFMRTCVTTYTSKTITS